jgi:excinuclease ABC subunit A
MAPATIPQPALRVVNARTHNLKGVTCHIPHGRVTVVTGPSGAGKSSFTFDTVYAEGQRRFIESMSTYVRQFLEQMERPAVDGIENVLPAVALEAKNGVTNARSTVGTITEIHDVLRLLFAHLGESFCPEGHGRVSSSTADEVVEELLAGAAGSSFLLTAAVARPARRSGEALRELLRQGYRRSLIDGQLRELEELDAWPRALDPLPLVLGRFAPRPAIRARLLATVEEAFHLGRGQLKVVGEAVERFFSRELGCPRCGIMVRRPTPALFSFNSPLGACETCQGFGRITGIDPARVIPDPRRTLRERPIAPWNTPAYEELYDGLYAVCEGRGIPLDVPWSDLPVDHRAVIWSGPEGGRKPAGLVTVDEFFRWLERRTYRVHVRVLLARYRAYHPCPACGGARLSPAARSIQVEGRTLPELTALSIEALTAWLADQRWSARQRAVAGHVLDELVERVDVLRRVGLSYLTLDRQARTLSGGESQRIHLAAALGGGLTSTLYVLDEPTVGLHPQDSDRLLDLLKDLAARGNTVLVVEHDRTLIRGADHIIDLGPEAGEQGGRLMAEGTLEDVLAVPESLTARYLRERPATAAREHLARFRREHGHEAPAERMRSLPRIRIQGARAHNLQGFDVELPVGTLVAVTGVSGSGKSTLIEEVLYGNFQRSRGVADVEAGPCDGLEGLEAVSEVTLVDQRPLGRSSRSNPVTYVKAYDDVRKLFAATRDARDRGITAGHFSFNLEHGRCPTCQGTGRVEVDMHFMAPVEVRCEVCDGRRFRREILAVRYRDKSIDQVLELTVDGALAFFAGHRGLAARLGVLRDVGLGYLRLGQSTSTLSGGEAQRLKLASLLGGAGGRGRQLFLFDEPTTGLHLADIDLLYRTLRRLVQRGDGVVVVEHSLDLVARADWIVDLGPGGGVRGGRLLFSGPLEDFLEQGDSPTADELRRHLKWEVAEPTAVESAVL